MIVSLVLKKELFGYCVNLRSTLGDNVIIKVNGQQG
jgi:hypothetical protein